MSKSGEYLNFFGLFVTEHDIFFNHVVVHWVADNPDSQIAPLIRLGADEAVRQSHLALSRGVTPSYGYLVIYGPVMIFINIIGNIIGDNR